MNFKEAKCPNCGGDLQVPEDKNTVKCMYCGSDIVVRQAIQKAVAESGPKLANLLNLAKTAQDSENNQEAYDYYTKVLEIDPENSEAWFGKAETAGWTSTLSQFRLPEMVSGVKKAIEYASEDRKEELRVQAARTINNITIAYYNLAKDSLSEYLSYDGGSWGEYLGQCDVAVKALESAHGYAPEDLQTMENIILICKDNIEGVEYKDQTNLDINGDPVSTAVGVKPEYEKTLKEKIKFYYEKIKLIDSSYSMPTIQKAKPSSCFIATATMGSYNDPSVLLLREFRDNWISKRRGGQKFIEHYYRLSPVVANIIAKNSILRYLSYYIIICPLTGLAHILLNKSQEQHQKRIKIGNQTNKMS